MIYVTRKAHFAASHRLYNPEFSDEKNDAIFDKCNNHNGHGHNYVIEVTVAGIPDPDTGYVIDLKELARVLDREVVDHVDHKHLNFRCRLVARCHPDRGEPCCSLLEAACTCNYLWKVARVETV